MLKRSGYADLPLHYGKVPKWLFDRMSILGRSIIESIVYNFGKNEVLTRLSDPLWFQSMGCVMGMDWHSSGITTSVLGSLKSAINPISKELGIYFCGGRGRYALNTPNELKEISDKNSLNSQYLIQCSRLSAKIDNTAVQDGFQIYLHSFVVTDKGEWAVIQQGMNEKTRTARRYHWLSGSLKSFIEEPHSGVVGENQGLILNLVAKEAKKTQDCILEIAGNNPEKMINEIKKITMPVHHEVKEKDVDLKRLAAVLAVSYNKRINDFADLLLIKGLGPRTLQSLTLVSQVIFGTPREFSDPARYSFAHGGKDGHPFPVPLKVYDKTIQVLKTAVEKAKLGINDKMLALKKLSELALKFEKRFEPKVNFNKLIEKEKKESNKYGGMTVFDKSKKI